MAADTPPIGNARQPEQRGVTCRQLLEPSVKTSRLRASAVWMTRPSPRSTIHCDSRRQSVWCGRPWERRSPRPRFCGPWRPLRPWAQFCPTIRRARRKFERDLDATDCQREPPPFGSASRFCGGRGKGSSTKNPDRYSNRTGLGWVPRRWGMPHMSLSTTCDTPSPTPWIPSAQPRDRLHPKEKII